MHAHVATADHVVVGPPADTIPRFRRRGGPLMDFISANFLYILTTVAVAGVAAGAFLAYEQHTYSRDLRAIQVAIATYTSRQRLDTLTLARLANALPANIVVDQTTGVISFGGLLAGGLPMRIYGGNPATGVYAPLGAGSTRQLVLLVGDENDPANSSSAICQDIARVTGPGVRSIQLHVNTTTPAQPAGAATGTPPTRGANA